LKNVQTLLGYEESSSAAVGAGAEKIHQTLVIVLGKGGRPRAVGRRSFVSLLNSLSGLPAIFAAVPPAQECRLPFPFDFASRWTLLSVDRAIRWNFWSGGMHFLLLILRLVLDCLLPAWRDSLKLAARADGRIQHLLARPGGLWDRRPARGAQKARPRSEQALEVRAGGRLGPSGSG
jgi:hypothetical protein